ncbi:MAG: RluA family pseudouridine synthase [Acidobacteriota bacterium]|nr:RluA family pseudouridine synthase [Acidobacteriota bacterium]
MRNQGRQITLPVVRKDAGGTLGDYLVRHARFFSGHDAADWLIRGCFQVDGREAGADTMLTEGSQLVLLQPAWDEPDVPQEIPIVFQDNDLLAVDKPAGIPTTPAGDFYLNALVHLLRRRTGIEALSPLHRLDLETTGLVIFACRTELREPFQKRFREGRVDKTYHALVHGHFPKERTVIDLPLGRHPRIHTRFIHLPGGKPARTEITRVTYFADFSLLHLKPRQGRTNQIRAHLAETGHPIVGDKKYHREERVFFDWLQHRDLSRLIDDLLLPHQALHCAEMDLGGGYRFKSKMDIRDQVKILV